VLRDAQPCPIEPVLTLQPLPDLPATAQTVTVRATLTDVNDNCTFCDATTGGQRSFTTTLTFSITDEHLVGSGSQLGTDDYGGTTCTFSVQYYFEMSRVP